MSFYDKLELFSSHDRAAELPSASVAQRSDDDALRSVRTAAHDASPPAKTVKGQSGPSNVDVTIPILIPTQKAEPGQTEVFKRSDPAARRYLDAKDSIVLIEDAVAGLGFFDGTGFIVSSDGKVVTDRHVVDDGGTLTVQTADGTKYSAHVIKRRPTSDLAELQIDLKYPGKKFKPLPIAANSNNLDKNSELYAVGHPRGWTDVYLSPGRFAQYDKRSDPWAARGGNPEQTMLYASIHCEPGNSGSPVLNQDGKVVGVLDSGSRFGPHTTAAMNSAEELHTLLGDQPPAPLSDYIVPKHLHFSMRTIEFATAGILGYTLLQGPRTTGLRNKLSALGATAIAIAGSTSAVYDVPFLKAALQTGTTAEKVDAGIDVTADALMMSGAIGLFSPRLRFALGAAQLIGIGIKSVNDLLSDRKF